MLSRIRCAKSAACESRHKGGRVASVLLATVASLAFTSASHQSAVTRHPGAASARGLAKDDLKLSTEDRLEDAYVQPVADPGAAGQTAAGASHRAPGPVEEEHAGRGIVDILARLTNFAILVGILTYFLKSPIRKYLSDRSKQIRTDLVNAAQLKETATAQIAEIDRRMQALPAELDALRKQGAEDIAAEEERIREATAAERERLLEQARREIELQVKVAERGLVAHAAELAVGVASDRIKRNITDEDQKHLVDRYVQQLRP